MLTNDQMTPDRFARWARARARLAFIHKHLDQGRTVYSTTALRVVKLTAKNRDQIRATKTGLLVQHGNKWLSHDYTTLTTSA